MDCTDMSIVNYLLIKTALNFYSIVNGYIRMCLHFIISEILPYCFCLLGCEFFETSAKDNIQVTETFNR